MILGRPGEPWFRKGLQHAETFEGLLREVLATEPGVWVETDMRAHLNPRRQAVIRRAAQRLADRLSQRTVQPARRRATASTIWNTACPARPAPRPPHRLPANTGCVRPVVTAKPVSGPNGPIPSTVPAAIPDAMTATPMIHPDRLTHLRALEARVHPHPARGGSGDAQPLPVLLHRQGLHRAVAPGAQGLLSGAGTVPVAACDDYWEFGEMAVFRDRLADKLKLDMRVHINPDGARLNITPFSVGSAKYTDVMKTEALKQALDQYGFDACFGGARRDEKIPAKERVCSFRDNRYRWDLKQQRPELWQLYNTRVQPGKPARFSPFELDRTGYLAGTSTWRTSRSSTSTAPPNGRWW